MAEFEKAIVEGKSQLHRLFNNVEDAMMQLTDAVDDFEELRDEVVTHLEEAMEALEGKPEAAKYEAALELWTNIDMDDLRVETAYNTDQEFGKVEVLPIV